nr:MAG TPA: hypothetical protein [Caudoviricetes sp.]
MKNRVLKKMSSSIFYRVKNVFNKIIYNVVR